MSSPEEYFERGLNELYSAYKLERSYEFGLPDGIQTLVFASIEAYARRADCLFRLACADQSIVEHPPGFVRSAPVELASSLEVQSGAQVAA